MCVCVSKLSDFLLVVKSLTIQYGFRPSQSTVDLLTFVSDRIARAFDRLGAA